MVPNVRHGDRVGELRALADEILFTEVESETVRRIYQPQYSEDRDERVGVLSYREVTGVERDGVAVRLRTGTGEEGFAFERDADADVFASLVSERIDDR